MNVDFLGAAGTVTGSMHLITTEAGSRILLDCGMYQGRRSEAYEINSRLPFNPASLDAVILSHAHIDHSGLLPMLVSKPYKGGFDAYICCTHATRDLCSIMLSDSAHIQESDAAYLRKRHREVRDPLYTMTDALKILDYFAGYPYHKEFKVTDDVTCTFFDAGHILGSASCLLSIREAGGTIRLGFTGDIGRNNRPILKDPEPMGDVDYLISESTYGGKHSPPYPDIPVLLREVIERTTSRGGKVIIPAFALGRTQDIVYILNGLFESGELARVPIYVDSPMATSTTAVYRHHPECYDEETATLLLTDPDPFGFDSLRYLRTTSESMTLNHSPEPCVIISASGMMESGRIVHHLKNHIEDERNTILVAGYQAEHTLGRRIIDREEVVNIMGKPYYPRAEVVVLNGLSAHADHNELVGYIGRFDRERLKKVFLVHGEPDAAVALRSALLHETGVAEVEIPTRGSRYTLTA